MKKKKLIRRLKTLDRIVFAQKEDKIDVEELPKSGEYWRHFTGVVYYIFNVKTTESHSGIVDCISISDTSGHHAYHGVYSMKEKLTESDISKELLLEAARRYKIGDVIKTAYEGVDCDIVIDNVDFKVFESNKESVYYTADKDAFIILYNEGEWFPIEDKFAEQKEAHKNGAKIQVKIQGSFRDDYDPSWDPKYEYRVKPENKPEKGDVCKFWDDDESIFAVGVLKNVDEDDLSSWYYKTNKGDWFKNAKVLTPEEALELLYGKNYKTK